MALLEIGAAVRQPVMRLGRGVDEALAGDGLR
jgi:hypothetical protein